MGKVSTAFLVGFAAITLAGAGSAQVPTNAPTLAVPNSLSSQAAAFSGSAKNGLTLNAPSEAGSIGQAISLSSIGIANSLKESGFVGPDSIASAKLDAAKSQSAPLDSSNLFKNALSSVSLSNALQSGGQNGSAKESLNAVAALGVGTTSLGNAIGDQRVIATQRIGN